MSHVLPSHRCTACVDTYQTVDARVKVYPKLLKLSGRLDLVLSQLSAREQAMSAAAGHKAGRVFHERDGDENDEEEDDEGEDEDEDMSGSGSDSGSEGDSADSGDDSSDE